MIPDEAELYENRTARRDASAQRRAIQTGVASQQATLSQRLREQIERAQHEQYVRELGRAEREREAETASNNLPHRRRGAYDDSSDDSSLESNNRITLNELCNNRFNNLLDDSSDDDDIALVAPGNRPTAAAQPQQSRRVLLQNENIHHKLFFFSGNARDVEVGTAQSLSIRLIVVFCVPPK